MRLSIKDIVIISMAVFLLGVCFMSFRILSTLNEMYKRLSTIESNTFDYRYKGGVDSISVQISWMGNPASGVSVSVRDKNLNYLFGTKTNQIGIAEMDLNPYVGTLISGNEYYIRIVYTAHFVEGGEETRYIYVLFTFVHNAKNELEFSLDFRPNVWEDSPIFSFNHGSPFTQSMGERGDVK